MVEVEKAFIEFVAKYGKTYSTRDAHKTRFQIFKENYEKIVTHNSQQKGYTLGVNRFSDMSEEEFVSIYGKLKEEDNSDNSEFKPLLGRPHRYNTNTDEEQKKPTVEMNYEGRYKCKHDDEQHHFFDYNDYNYMDSLPKCKRQDWV